MSLSLRHRLFARLHRTPEGRQVFSDVLYETRRVRTLEESVTLFSSRLCQVLRLEAVHFFLVDGNRFTRRQHDATVVPGAYAFPASCSSILHMKREHRPFPFTRERPDAWQFLASEAELEAFAAAGTQLIVPLVGRTSLVGFATLSRSAAPPTFTKGELNFLEQLGTEFGHSLETAMLVERLSQESVRRTYITRELELAREVQERLLPSTLPTVSGLDTAASYRSAEQIGGDYFDLFPTASGLICAVVADVSGHGISSALLMATLRASLHSLLEENDGDLTDTVERLSRLLFSASSASRYSTAFILLYDPAGSEFVYVNAGHNPPLLLHSDGLLSRLDAGGTVIGLLPSAAWTQTTVPFRTGDFLVAYTDGITEACNGEGDQWGESGLLQAMASTAGRSAQDVVTHLVEQLEAFTGNAPQDDDRTLLVLRITGTHEAA